MGDMRGERVLDVAGGKGELAYQLANITRVAEVHVIDPRPLQLDRFKRWRAKVYCRSSVSHFDCALDSSIFTMDFRSKFATIEKSDIVWCLFERNFSVHILGQIQNCR